MSLLVIGSMAFDALETPYGKTDKIVGGAATYIAYAAAQFTDQIQLVSVVGGDFPNEVIEELQQRGVDTEGLQIKADEKSFFWSGKYHDNMNQRDTLVTELNVLGSFDPILPETYKTADYIMLGNLQPTVQHSVINRLSKKPKFIALDTMNFWMDNTLTELLEVIKHIDCLIINDEEARQLSGEYHLKLAAKKIMKMGPSILVIKKGEHGALLFKENDLFYCPALPLEMVFDPTGAGDTFAGGFCGYLSKTDDLSFDNLKRAIVYGSALASFCVEKFGTERLVNLDRSELEKRVQQFVDIVKFDLSLVMN